MARPERSENSNSLLLALDLGMSNELRKTLPRTVDFCGRRFRIVDVDVDGDLVVHSATCPHWLGPLAGCEVVDEIIVCPWHGYRFNARTGESADGHKLRLAAAARLAVDPDTGGQQLLTARRGFRRYPRKPLLRRDGAWWDRSGRAASPAGSQHTV